MSVRFWSDCLPLSVAKYTRTDRCEIICTVFYISSCYFTVPLIVEYCFVYTYSLGSSVTNVSPILAEIPFLPSKDILPQSFQRWQVILKYVGIPSLGITLHEVKWEYLCIWLHEVSCYWANKWLIHAYFMKFQFHQTIAL